MKQLYTLIIGTLLSSCFLFAQQNVELVINHGIDNQTLEFESTQATNSSGVTYDVNRLEYYLGSIVLTHDGGQETALADDFYILVNAADGISTIDLGNHDIENIEALNFAIGITEGHNHDDPAAWPNDHPLAPQDPSMHWGWAAGYRFIAYHGTIYDAQGEASNIFEYHAVGDELRKEVALEATGEMIDDILTITLDTDYNPIMQDIDIIGNNIIHGGGALMGKMMKNMKDFGVFTPKAISTDISEINKDYQLTNYPNPFSESTVISYEFPNVEQLSMRITDVNGRTIVEQNNLASKAQLELNNQLNAGVYYCSFYAKSGFLAKTQLLVVE